MTNHETDRRERYATAISKWHRDPELPLYIQGADAVIAIADQEQAELRRERDLAVAHDRQPYPTAWAYEQACKALRRKEAAIERVLEFAASLDETGRQLAGPDAVHPVAAHIRHLLDAQPAEREHDAAPAAVSVPPPAPRADDRGALRDRIAERPERYAVAIHDAMESDLSLVDQEPGQQALFARAADAVMALADSEQATLRRKLAAAEKIRENADFHLGQEMARRQLAEKEAARLSADQAAVLNAAAQHLYTALFPAVYDDMGQKAAEGVNRAVSELRRLAAASGPVAGEQQNETPEAESAACGHRPDHCWGCPGGCASCQCHAADRVGDDEAETP